MNRFDIPDTVKNYLEVAIETRTIDAIDVYALGAKYGDNWHGMIEEVNYYAFCNRHVNKEAHKSVVQAAEEYWMTQPIRAN